MSDPTVCEVAPRQHAFCFVHAADLHLDTPFKGIHEVAPEIAETLREASLEAFDAIVELALSRRAAFLLVAGDVYDGAERGLRAQLRFRDGLARLSDAGIASFVVHGNHDPVSTGWSAVDTWPPGVTIFPPGAVTVVPVERDGQLLATVQGVSYARARTTENLALGFSRPEGPGFHIGLLHCNVQGVAEGYDDYAPCTLDDLRRTRLDYLALGHVHQTRILSRGGSPGDPAVVYPGNSQARSPKPSERGAKGAMVVEVLDGGVDRLEHVACDSVRFAGIDLDIGAFDDLVELDEALGERAADQLEAADGRSIVLRARLTGRGPLHHDLRRGDALAALLRRQRERAATGRPFCWWDGIEDATTPPLVLEQVRGRGDFAADLLEEADAVASQSSTRDAIASELVGSLPRYLASEVEMLLAEGGGGGGGLAGLLESATVLALGELGDAGAEGRSRAVGAGRARSAGPDSSGPEGSDNDSSATGPADGRTAG